MPSDPSMHPTTPALAASGPTPFPLGLAAITPPHWPDAASAPSLAMFPAPPLSPTTSIDCADQQLQATLARLTGGISPLTLGLANADWALHLLASPAKWQRLLHGAAGVQLRLLGHAARSMGQLVGPPQPVLAAPAQERRFRHPAWRAWPYSLYQRSYLLNRQWWDAATSGVPGVSEQHERLVGLVTHQLLDLFAPSNNIFTSPDVLDATLREGGQNLVRGTIALLEDLDNQVQHLPPPGAEQFVPGKQVALTRGKVIFRNRLLELLQYLPLTDDVHPQPLLIVPAWDSKYYLLDLSRRNSLVSHLVHQGHTVFMLSWYNPHAAEPDLAPEHYLAALAAAAGAVRAIVPGQAIHAVAHGAGATLPLLAAASDAVAPYASLSLLLPQTDFTLAADLLRRTAGAATTRIMHEYLLGQRAPLTDLDAWRADRPRVPYRMQREQLRALLPDASLGSGRLRLHGRTLALHTIRAPVFVLGAEHAATLPWHDSYQLKRSFDTALTFVLAGGDQDTALLSVPGTGPAHFRLGHWPDGSRHDDAARWYHSTAPVDGSWWPSWLAWLAGPAPAPMAEPPAVGAPGAGYPVLAAAPGAYVLQR